MVCQFWKRSYKHGTSSLRQFGGDRDRPPPHDCRVAAPVSSTCSAIARRLRAAIRSLRLIHRLTWTVDRAVAHPTETVLAEPRYDTAEHRSPAHGDAPSYPASIGPYAKNAQERPGRGDRIGRGRRASRVPGQHPITGGTIHSGPAPCRDLRMRRTGKLSSSRADSDPTLLARLRCRSRKRQIHHTSGWRVRHRARASAGSRHPACRRRSAFRRSPRPERPGSRRW